MSEDNNNEATSRDKKSSQPILGSLTVEEGVFLQNVLHDDNASNDDKDKAQKIVDRIAKELMETGNDKRLIDALERSENAELGNYPDESTREWWEAKPDGFDHSIPVKDLPTEYRVKHFPETDEYFVIVNTNDEISEKIDEASVLSELRELCTAEVPPTRRPKVYIQEETNTFASFYTIGIDPTEILYVPPE